MKKGMLFVIWLMLSSILATAVVEEGVKEPETLAVEADIPDYLPSAEILQHPTKFFSGQPLRLRGDFSGLDLESVRVEILGKESGVLQVLEIRRVTPEYVSVDVPPEIPTDLYDLTLSSSGKAYKATVQINGFSKEDLQLIEGGRGGSIEKGKPLSAAILYTSRIQCIECYWESVLTGHPINPKHLVIVGMGGSFRSDVEEEFQVSHDGGRTWIPVTLDMLHSPIDPNALVTPDGTLLLSGLNWIRPTPEDPRVVVGVFFQGPVTGNVFSGTIFKKVVEGVELQHGTIFIDYPKLAYDPTAGTIYISGNLVRFSQTGVGDGLFVSRDGGRSFIEQRLRRVEMTKEIVLPNGRRLRSTIIGGPIWSMDTTTTGSLRALITFPAYPVEISPERREPFGLLRFDKEAQDFDFIQILSAWLQYPARVSASSDRGWHVYEGPEIAIDKSDRHGGRLYVIWAEPESVVEDPEFQFGKYGKNFDIFLSHSDDDGLTWSLPIKVNDDDTGGDQIYPSITVDQEGIVHVVFLDKREDPKSHYYDVYYAKIVDGRTSKNVRVNLEHIPNAFGGRDPGDYLDQLVAYPENVFVSYPCGRAIPTGQGRWQCAEGTNGQSPYCSCLTAIDTRRILFPGDFIRGDSNGDLVVDISDAINTLNWLFLGGQEPSCKDAADANDDGTIDISDALLLLDFLFHGDPKKLSNPFPNVGNDPTDDKLTC